MSSIDRFVSFVQQRTNLPESSIRQGVRTTDRLQSREAEDKFVTLCKDSNAAVQLDRAMGMVTLIDPNCERARAKVNGHPKEVRSQGLPLIRDIERELVEKDGLHLRSHPSIIQDGTTYGQAEQIVFSDPGKFPQVPVGQVFFDSTPGEKGELWFFAPASATVG